VRALVLAVLLSSLAPFAASQELKSATLYAEKIYCGACAAVITKALRNVPGVSKVSVDVERKEVLVQFDGTKSSVEDLTAATAKRGFPSTVRKAEP
jgi:mercuric ion binding protein